MGQHLNMKTVTKEIASLFQPYVPQIKNEEGLVKMTVEEREKTKTWRRELETIEFDKSEIVLLRQIEKSKNEDGEETSEVRHYILVTGNLELIEDRDTIKTEVSALHIYPLMSFTKTRLKDNITSNEIVEYISPIVMGGEIDQCRLLEFFGQFSLYIVSPEGKPTSKEDLFRIAGRSYLLNKDNRKHLSFSPEMIDELVDSLNDVKIDLNLIGAITADKWQYCYFEIYRCIEPLFTNYVAKQIMKELGVSHMGHREVFDILNKNYLVIPNEDKCITGIFEEHLSESLRTEFCSVLSLSNENDKNKTSSRSIGRKVYKIRNHIVHHPESASSKKDYDSIPIFTKEMENVDWNELSFVLLKAYRLFKSKVT